MKVSATEIERRQVVLDIEVEPERLQKALDSAYKRAANRVNVPGFRRGKAPRPLVERVVGPQNLLEDALEKLIPEVYDEAIGQEQIQPWGRPRFEVTNTEPLQFKATLPLQPKVTLGEYQEIRRAQPTAEPSDEEVDQVIQRLRENHAEWAPVERPVQHGDRVSLDVHMEADGRILLDSKDAESIADPERPQPAPGFAEELIGMEPGRSREFTITLPADYEDAAIAGEAVQFRVTLHGIKERRLPELDDEFAHLVGDEYETTDALQSAIRAQIGGSKSASAQQELEAGVIADAIAGSTFEIPPQVVQRQADLLLQNFGRTLDRQGINIEQYMRFTNRTPETFRAELMADAERALERSLVLDAIADAEGLTPSDEAIEAEIRRMSAAVQNPDQVAEAALASDDTRDRLRTALRQRDAIRRLLTIAVPGYVADAPEGVGPAEPDAGPAEPKEEEVHV